MSRTDEVVAELERKKMGNDYNYGWMTSYASLLEEVLTTILPMAKGYAAEHPVGRNAEMVADAETVLRCAEGGLIEK